jgi:L-lactate dehydrogenase complex protein LldE
MPLQPPSTVTLFIPCLMDALYPRTARDLVSLLKKLGFKVDFPWEQTCCGQPAFNQGFFPQARSLARRFLSIFDPAELIVCPSGSCTAMVKKHYPDLFQQEPEWLAKARKTSEKIFELTQFLHQFGLTDKIQSSFPFKVTYHDACHSNRMLGIFQEPRELLARVRGLQLIEMEFSDKCCGFGGLFSKKFPRISKAIGMEKVAAIKKTEAQWVVSNEPGCLMQIQSGLFEQRIPIGIKHIVEILNATFGD